MTRGGLTVIAFVVCVAGAWACSGHAMRVMGDAMVEGGTALSDASSDASALTAYCGIDSSHYATVRFVVE